MCQAGFRYFTASHFHPKKQVGVRPSHSSGRSSGLSEVIQGGGLGLGCDSWGVTLELWSPPQDSSRRLVLGSASTFDPESLPCHQPPFTHLQAEQGLGHWLTWAHMLPLSHTHPHTNPGDLSASSQRPLTSALTWFPR